MKQDTSASIRRFLTRKGARQGIPVSGTFELTPRCNLRCKMCYVRLTPEEMAPIGRELTEEEWLALAASAKEAGLTFLLLTGGEPTLRTDFLRIYEGLAQMGFSIGINTNGTLLSPELRALWHRLPPAQVNVTLYGVSREDYAALCGEGSAFDRVADALSWLKSEGILIHLNTTMVPTNVHQWEKLELFAREMELELRMTSYCFPPIRREGCASCPEFTRLSPEQAAELTLRDIRFREGMAGLLKRAGTLSSPPMPDFDAENGEEMKCLAGRSQFWVTWDGRMTPCGMLPAPVVRPIKDGFFPAWEKLKQETASIRLCPDCVSCPDKKTCMNCAAVTLTETGRYDGKPEYMCRYNRAYRKHLTKLLSSE